AVEHVRLLGERPMQGVDGRAVAEGADADPDRAGVVVEDVELVAVLVDRDDVAGLVPGVADGVAGRLLVERRDQPGLGPGPRGGEQGDVVAAVGQPRGRPRAHPLDAAVAAGRDAVPGGSDEGDTHGASSNPQHEGVRSTRSGTSTTIAQQTEDTQPGGPAGPWQASGRGLGRAGAGALVPVGHRTLGQAVDQRPDLAVRVPAVPPEGADEGQLALLGPSGDGLGRHLEQGRGLRRCQVLGLTRLGLAHCTPSYGHGPAGRGDCCVGCRARSGEAPAHPVVLYPVCSAGACWTLMTTTSPSLRSTAAYLLGSATT